MPIWIRTSYHCSIHLFSRWNTEIPEEAAAQEPVCSTTPKKKVRQNRNMLDGLPVVEIVIEPEGVDPG